MLFARGRPLLDFVSQICLFAPRFSVAGKTDSEASKASGGVSVANVASVRAPLAARMRATPLTNELVVTSL
jgi:hypothetical protein